MKVKHSNLIKLGDKIRELRISKGYSQEGIADAAGMGRTYMGRVERGEQNISIQNLIQIAFALNVEVGFLIPPLSELKNPNNETN
ncbi:TPA: helix-turn-helix transcriptional regulator [Legionella pneumophila]|nr:helix-turn-helix transcriptional regulator [Legionella pneumophila]